MLVLKAADRIARPWKNGGGITRDVFTLPEGAGLESFDWRVSIADVASDGPFSRFGGIDRTTAILTGNGFVLAVDGLPPATLTANSPPLSYPGDAPATARLINGDTTDLNIMTRRGRMTHSLRRLALDGAMILHTGAALVLWTAGQGWVRTQDEDGKDTLATPMDAFVTLKPTQWHFTPAPSASLWVAEFEKIA